MRVDRIQSAAELLEVQADHETLEADKVADVVVFDGAYDDLAGRGERVRDVLMGGERVRCRSCMLEHGTWLVPTLSAPRAVLAQADAGAPMSDAVVAKARLVAAVHDASVRRAVDAGVKVAMGTDCGVGVHGTNLEELGHLAAVGMPPAQVWAAASGVAAELLGVEADHGTLEVGKVADVVVVDGAYDDWTGLGERVREVWMAGERVSTRGDVAH